MRHHTDGIEPPDILLTAAQLPSLMRIYDGRGQMVSLRQFIKDWAASDTPRRTSMVCDEPDFSGPGEDKISAIVCAVADALCERDGVPAPDWAASHRSAEPIWITGHSFADTGLAAHVREIAPAACLRHDVWFTEKDLQDYRIHGLGD